MKYHSDHISNPSMYTDDHFGDLFRYGLVSPLVEDDAAIQKAFQSESSLATAVPMIDLKNDDPKGKHRLQWNKSLGRFFGSLLKDDKIQGIVYDITIDRVLTYIKSDPEGADELTHKFAEYIVGEIGSKAYEENIQFSITSMINTEKRPNISLIVRAQLKESLEHFLLILHQIVPSVSFSIIIPPHAIISPS